MTKKYKSKKKIIRISIILVIILIIFLAIAKKNKWIGSSTNIKVAIELPQKRTIIETVSANGKIQPAVEVKISPDVSGEVVDLLVKEGDKVKNGDLLAKINPDFYQSNLEQMSAALNMQKANLANAKARAAQVEAQFINAKSSFDRIEKLYKEKVVSLSEYETAQANYLVAKEELTAAKESVKASEFTVLSSEAALKEAKDNLNKTSIYSPMDGTISSLSVEKGERVVGTSQFAGTEIMRIANLREMEANVTVNENDIVRVNLGDTAIVEVDAYQNRKFKGVVTEIANSATVTGTSTEQVTNFNVKIKILRESYSDLIDTIHSKQSPFRPGMSTNVEIQTNVVYNAISIPIQSIIAKSDTASLSKINKETQNNNNKNYAEFVYIFDNGTAKLVNVASGIQDNMYIEFVSGLDEKSEVIVAPYRAITKLLKDGDEVTKVERWQLYEKTEF